MEVVFDYEVECNGRVAVNYQTPQEAIAAANDDWQELCDEGDYEYGEGDATIYIVDTDTGETVLTSEVTVISDDCGEIADGRGESL